MNGTKIHFYLILKNNQPFGIDGKVLHLDETTAVIVAEYLQAALPNDEISFTTAWVYRDEAAKNKPNHLRVL